MGRGRLGESNPAQNMRRGWVCRNAMLMQTQCTDSGETATAHRLFSVGGESLAAAMA